MAHQLTKDWFPWRALLSGELRGKALEDLAIMVREPDAKDGEIWQWRYVRCVPEGVLGDPHTAIVTLWGDAGLAAHAHLYMEFPDGLKWTEVLW